MGLHQPDIGLPTRQIEPVPCRQDLFPVPVGKAPEAIRQIQQFAAEFGQRIIDPGRNGGKHGAGDEPVAFKLAQGKAKDPNATIDGLTPDQRFFINFAQVWRRAFRDAELKRRLNVDPHAPAQFRAIAAPSNMTAFAQAFGCKSGDAMVRDGEKHVKIW